MLDELLLLPIMDVLIRNLILYADGEDHRHKEHHGEESHNVWKLEQTIRSCGVCMAEPLSPARDLVLSPGRGYPGGVQSRGRSGSRRSTRTRPNIKAQPK